MKSLASTASGLNETSIVEYQGLLFSLFYRGDLGFANLDSNLFDLLLGGSDTTSKMLEW